MNAAADRRNWIRTLMVYIVASVPVDVMVVPDGDDTAPPTGQGQWVRVQLDDVTARGVGLRSTNRIAERRLLVTADCFARGTQLDGVSTVDAIDGLAATVCHALTNMSLPLKDYVGDGSTLAGSPLRTIDPATIRPLPSIAGIQRRQVLAPAVLIHEV
ncbi:MAG: hypothetical protein ACEQSX_15535 [Baekduiaceae bacterium]